MKSIKKNKKIGESKLYAAKDFKMKLYSSQSWVSTFPTNGDTDSRNTSMEKLQNGAKSFRLLGFDISNKW